MLLPRRVPVALYRCHRFCNFCKAMGPGSRKVATCVLCRQRGGAMLACDVDRGWVHNLCAGLIPETSIVRGIHTVGSTFCRCDAMGVPSVAATTGRGQRQGSACVLLCVNDRSCATCVNAAHCDVFAWRCGRGVVQKNGFVTGVAACLQSKDRLSMVRTQGS